MNWHNKKVIVTGGTGVIGRHLIKKLEDLGCQVRCFDIVPKPKDFSENIEYSPRDLTYLNPLEFTSFDPEVIFHLAAAFERTEEEIDFWEFNYQNNVLASHKTIESAKLCKNLEKFIFASSYLIYNPDLYTFKKNPKVVHLKEIDSVNARNLCGAAKYYTEKELEYLDHFPNYGFSKISARIFRVYGENSRDFISRSVRDALNGHTIKLFLKENSFDYIYAGDVAEGLIMLAESNVKNGVFNLGSGESRKIEEIMTIFKKYFPKLKITNIKSAGLFEGSCADMANFNTMIGFKSRARLEQGIKKIIDHEAGKEN